MSEATFMSGPWVAEFGPKGSYNIKRHPGLVICSRSPWDHYAGMSCANAHLIASAPELYAALLYLSLEVSGSWSLLNAQIRQDIGNTNYQCIADRIEQAKAALRKARGES